jgi:uncharacterized protein (TIGR00369 family)
MTQMQEAGSATAAPVESAARTRTYSWSDPQATAAALGRQSGTDMLRAIQRGEIPAPPIMHTLDLESFELVAEGSCAFALRAQEFHYNPLGTVHGGVIATLLDSAAGCAVHSTLPAGWGYTTLDLATKYLRPATVDTGRLRAEGTVLHRGRTIALAEARLVDERGRLLAHATSSCLLFELPA